MAADPVLPSTHGLAGREPTIMRPAMRE